MRLKHFYVRLQINEYRNETIYHLAFCRENQMDYEPKCITRNETLCFRFIEKIEFDLLKLI